MASLLDIEPRLNRICGYKYLPELKVAIKREIEIHTGGACEYIFSLRDRGVSSL